MLGARSPVGTMSNIFKRQDIDYYLCNSGSEAGRPAGSSMRTGTTLSAPTAWITTTSSTAKAPNLPPR